MTEQEEVMFGMSREQIRIVLADDILSVEMQVISILSDVQHLMEIGQNDRARKFINIAKFILAEHPTAKMAKKKAA